MGKKDNDDRSKDIKRTTREIADIYKKRPPKEEPKFPRPQKSDPKPKQNDKS